MVAIQGRGSGGAPCAVRTLCEKSDACHRPQGPEFCTLQPLLIHPMLSILPSLCRVVFRDVPGINTVIIGAVRKRPQWGAWREGGGSGHGVDGGGVDKGKLEP